MPLTPAPNDGYVPDVSPVSGVPSQGTYFLGRYRIIDEIGLGGMASVHLARVDGLGGFQRWFAIKRIHAHLVEDETFVNMFLDEANVAARISHPNVATVFELGRHDDTYWIAMEYLHGEPLREVMRRTEEMGATMPPEIACRVIAEAADGLHAAHELQGKDGEKLNLIHRDVTPHNLFVTYEGVTKVVDFGIAKFQDRMASTQAGTLKGKLAYMSPEQVQGEAIDRRTDIFALGVVLWELTTGQRLFRMDSDLDTLAKVQECNIPPPSTMVRGYPLDLEKIVMQSLAKNRNDRFPTAREFSRALQSLLTRRGLFIASDEVAAYMASIFVDRIAKREEHLRWASAVSDAAAANAAASAQKASPTTAPRAAPPPLRPSLPPPVPASVAQPAGRVAPRPAAGIPARAPVSTANVNGPSAPASGPKNGAPRPATAPMQTRGQPPTPPRASSFPPPPRGGSSYPMPRAAKPAPPPDDSDDDDRTVQATVEQQAAANAAYDNAFDDEDDATIVSRAPSDTLPPSRPLRGPPPPAAGIPARSPGAPSQPTPQPAPTRSVAATVGRTVPLNAVAPMAVGMAAASRAGVLRTQMGLQPTGIPAAAPPAFDRGVPASFNITDPSLPHEAAPPDASPYNAPYNQGGYPAAGSASPSSQPATLAPPPLQPGPPPFAASGYGPQPPYGSPPPGYGGGGPAMPPPPGFGAPPPYDPNAYGAIDPNQYAPAYGNPGAPAFAPPIDPRNATQAVIRPKRVPAWAVAVASGLVALALVGGILLIYALFHASRKPEMDAKNGAVDPAAGSSPPSPTSAGSAASSGSFPGSTGLFGAARSGFLAAAAPAPVVADPPPEAPPPAPVPTASAPPAADPDPATSAAAAAPATPPPPVAPDPPAPPPAPVAVAPTRAYQPPSAPAPAPQPAYVAPRAAPASASVGRGTLSVLCFPACSRIELDGVSIGPSPIFKQSVPAGTHRLKLVTSNPPGIKFVSRLVPADQQVTVRESIP